MVQNIAAAIQPSSPVAWLFLLTISDNSGDPPLRVVNNAEAITSRGQVFEPYPFDVLLPQDDSESLPSVTLQIANLDPAIIEFVRRSTTPPTIAIELVTSQYPDTVESSLSFLRLSNVSYDALTLTGRLDVDNFLTQKFPGEGYVPPLFPAIFR